MARPPKHDWAEIRRHYEAGLNQSEIVRRFKCPKSSLHEKIRDEKWVVNELANSVVMGKIEVSERINELSEQDSELSRVAVTIGDEKASDTRYIKNASKFFLNKAIKKIEEDDHTMDDLFKGSKIVTECGMNIGVIDRHAPKVEVNNANNQQTNIEAPQFNLQVLPPK
jgi:hypothetical protein